MKNRDTILLEEAYNKTRLLKEQGDEPMSVDRFEKEERLKGHMQRAEQRAEDEIAPKLGPSIVDSLYNVCQKVEEGPAKDELHDIINELIEMVKKAKDNVDQPEVIETLLQQIGVD